MQLLRDRALVVDTTEKEIMVQTVADLMERRLDEASASDCSVLAWLYIHLKDIDRAKDLTRRGLERDPYDYYCNNLARRLDIL
jgi:hypothetical protein